MKKKTASGHSISLFGRDLVRLTRVCAGALMCMEKNETVGKEIAIIKLSFARDFPSIELYDHFMQRKARVYLEPFAGAKSGYNLCVDLPMPAGKGNGLKTRTLQQLGKLSAARPRATSSRK